MAQLLGSFNSSLTGWQMLACLACIKRGNKLKGFKMIYQELEINGFRDAFDKMGRGEHLSDEAMRALYRYFYSADDYQNIFDVIAICCEFLEYKTIEDFTGHYGAELTSWKDLSNKWHSLVLELENGGAVIHGLQ